MRAIHQFSPSVGFGDAVTNQLRLRRRALRLMGFASEIFAGQVPGELRTIVHPFSKYRPAADQLLIINHHFGFDGLDELMALPDRKVLSFNNITPARFFRPGLLRRLSELGRNQLLTIKSQVEGALCNSDFDAEELRLLGFERICVAPHLFDLDRLIRAPWTPPPRTPGAATILCVGRLIENKNQHLAVEVLRELTKLSPLKATLALVGSTHSSDYEKRVQRLIDQHGLRAQVHFAGHTTDAELRGWYRSSDALLSLSAHEGFGVPLIEAMALGLPVVATESSAVTLTMGGAGILLPDRDPQRVAAYLAVLFQDPAVRQAVVQGQYRRLAAYAPSALDARLTGFLTDLGISLPRPLAPRAWAAEPLPKVQVEGPFETNYSLALTNRELAEALERHAPGTVALRATEGSGDYHANPADLSEYPALEPLWKRGRAGSQAPVLIRNLHPPRVADMGGEQNLLHFGWEESELPAAWVQDFNRRLTAIATMSSFVTKTLVDNGVSVPVATVGIGADHVLRTPRRPFAGTLGKRFKFLHISSAFPRKGIDVLLRAYAEAFDDQADVTLVLKTFPNIHNTVEDQLDELRASRSGCPDIVWIDRDLSPGEMVDLYERCDALVAPSRGEGFGLPMAEAMLFNRPVITTAFGGARDFCDDQTAWLVDYDFARSQSHLAGFDSVWVEPRLQDLTRVMREVYEAPASAIRRKTELARERILGQHSWDRVAERVDRLVAEPARGNGARLRVGVVSSWNTRCGIASHSSYLVEPLRREAVDLTIFASRQNVLTGPDGDGVVRCWDDHTVPELDDLEAAIVRAGCEVVFIQFNFSFYALPGLARLIESLGERGIATIVLFHSTADVDKPDFQASLRDIAKSLAKADRLLVHGIADLNRFKAMGLVDNVALFPHGVEPREPREREDSARALGLPSRGPILATFGFCLPHKGLREMVEAMPAISKRHPGATLLLVNAIYPAPLSEQLALELKERIQALGLGRQVRHVTEYLSDAQSVALLQAASVVVFPYQDTQESSSAAVRHGLSSGRPIACTPLSIFDDVDGAIHRLAGTSPSALAAGLNALLDAPERLESIAPMQREWLASHRWTDVATRLLGMMRGVSRARSDAHAKPTLERVSR